MVIDGRQKVQMPTLQLCLLKVNQFMITFTASQLFRFQKGAGGKGVINGGGGGEKGLQKGDMKYKCLHCDSAFLKVS